MMKLWATISLMAALILASAQAQYGELRGEHADYPNLERRQAKVYDQDATAAATQKPVVTTIWQQVSVGSTVTYAPFTITQTFALVPDQWPSPASGEIGYGTLTKNNKREAEPTGIADMPVVLEISSVAITQWIQPYVTYTEVQYEAVWVPGGSANSDNQTVPGNMTNDATSHAVPMEI